MLTNIVNLLKMLTNILKMMSTFLTIFFNKCRTNIFQTNIFSNLKNIDF